MKNAREMIKNNIGKIRSAQQEQTIPSKEIKEYAESIVKSIYEEYNLPLDESYKKKVDKMYGDIMDDLKVMDKQ